MISAMRGVQLQHDNCAALLRLVPFIREATLAAVADPSPATLDARKAAVRELELALREAGMFALELSALSPKPWILHLVRPEEDLAILRDLARRLVIRTRALAAAARAAPPVGLEEFAEGQHMTVSEDMRQAALRGRVMDLADRANVLDAIQRITTNPTLTRQLTLELNATQPLFRTHTQDVTNVIEHSEVRAIWMQAAGPQAEKFEAREFVTALRAYFVNYDFGSGLKIHEATGLQLDERAREKLRAIFDYDGDGYVCLRDLNAVCQPINASLESIVLRLLDFQGTPNNLFHLPENYQPRPEIAEAIRNGLFSRATNGVAVLGPHGAGRATLTVAVAQQLMRDYRVAEKTMQGVFFVETRGLYRVPELLDTIAHTLRISGPGVMSLRELLARLQGKLRAGPIVLILNSIEGVLDPITGDDNIVGVLRAFHETPGLHVALVTTKDPGMPAMFPTVHVALSAPEGLRRARLSADAEENDVQVGTATPAPTVLAALEALRKPLRLRTADLAVFPGLFSLEAAEAVVGLKWWDLLGLVRRGLLDMRCGRFIVHPTVLAALQDMRAGASLSLDPAHERLNTWALQQLRTLNEIMTNRCSSTALALFDADRPIFNALIDLVRAAQAPSPLYLSIVQAISEGSDLLEARFAHDALINLLDDNSRFFAGKHPDVESQLQESIGLALQRSGDYPAAMERFIRSLEIRANAMGLEHADVAVAHQNIGSCLFSMGKYQEALEQHQQCLAIRIKAFGTEMHPAVAASYNVIGNCWFSLSKYENALTNYRKCLDLRIHMFGSEDISVAASYSSLGHFLQSQGRYEEAREQFEHALEIRLRTYSGDHPDVAASLSAVGSCLYAQGKFNEAYEQLQKTLQMQLRMLGPEHPSVATSYSGVGSCLYALGRHDEAIYLHRRCLELQLKTLGEEHPSVANSNAAIASCLQIQGNYPEALERFRKCMDIQCRVLGADHPAVATTNCNIGDCLMANGQYDESLGYYEKSLQIRVKKFGPEHPDVAASYGSIGTCWQFQNRPNKALENLRTCLDIQLKTLGPEHPDVATTHSAIGTCLQLKGKPQEALKEHTEAMDIRTKSYGPGHRLTKEAANDVMNTQRQSKGEKKGCACVVM